MPSGAAPPATNLAPRNKGDQTIMAVIYKFGGYKTKYKGVNFRSRLEATWAAFFDELDWNWEYEPFDLGAWSPDFLIRGNWRNALVEVKPIAEIDWDVLEKMSQAAYRLKSNHVLLFCGVSPYSRPYSVGAYVDLGLISSCCVSDPACWISRPFTQLIGGRYDLVFGHRGSYPWFVTGIDADNESAVRDRFVSDDIQRFWNNAKNAVQWSPQ
jgi:hypothetical protein